MRVKADEISKEKKQRIIDIRKDRAEKAKQARLERVRVPNNANYAGKSDAATTSTSNQSD